MSNTTDSVTKEHLTRLRETGFITVLKAAGYERNKIKLATARYRKEAAARIAKLEETRQALIEGCKEATQ